MKLFIYFSVVVTFINMVVAGDPWHPSNGGVFAVAACKTAISKTAKLCAKDTVKSYACACADINFIGSMAYCGKKHVGHSENKWDHFIETYISSCPKLTAAKIDAALNNVTDYLVDVSTLPNFNSSKVVNFPVYAKEKFYKTAYRSQEVRYGNKDDAVYMGAACIGYWGVIVLFSGIYNFLSKLGLQKSKALNNSFTCKIRQYITLPATFGKSHTAPVYIFKVFGGLIPTRIESIVLVVFLALNMVFEGVRYYYVEGNTIWPAYSAQMSRYVGDRSGIISLYLVVLTFLFGGRNNFLIWITGWKQSTFITYHRWLGRIAALTMVLHSIAMWVQSAVFKKLATRILTDWYQSGIVATVAVSIMFLTSFHTIRKHFYEIFLYIHIAMGIAFIVGTWKHVVSFGWGAFVKAVIAVWVFDRGMRLVRIAAFGATKKAQVKVVANETLRVTIPLPSYWKCHPGNFSYLYFLTPTTFFQSHPFTMVKDGDSVHFYCKIKSGVTKRIYEKLQAGTGEGSIRVAVEGPYGTHIQMKHYDNALLYSGGNGIPGLYDYARELANSNTFVKLHWVIRNWDSVQWFKEELTQLHSMDVVVTIHVTRETSDDYSISSHHSNSSDGEKDHHSKEENQEKEMQVLRVSEMFPKFDIKFGRPGMAQYVTSDLQQYQGSVAIMTCAHADLVDDVRATVAQSLSTRPDRIDLFEELQTW